MTPDDSAEKLGIRNPATIKAMQEFKKRLKEDNERLCSERNSRRWRHERNPVDYEKQKLKQREAYQDLILDTEARPVRSYIKVPGRGPQKVEERKARNAERMRKQRALQTAEDRTADADRKWASRKRDAGWSEPAIAEGLEARRRTSSALQGDPGPRASDSS